MVYWCTGSDWKCKRNHRRLAIIYQFVWLAQTAWPLFLLWRLWKNPDPKISVNGDYETLHCWLFALCLLPFETVHQAGNLFEYWSLPRNCTTRKFTLFSCMQKSASSPSSSPLSMSKHQAMNLLRWCLSVKFRYKNMGLWKRKRLIEWEASFSAFDWVYPIRRIRWFNAQNKYFLART